jgi:hypothetical protein
MRFTPADLKAMLAAHEWQLTSGLSLDEIECDRCAASRRGLEVEQLRRPGCS